MREVLEPWNTAGFGCVVDYFAYKHSVNGHPSPVVTGDIIGAIGAVVALVTALVLLFGASENTESKTPVPVPVQTATERPGEPTVSVTPPR